ncbi:MAG: hypothetical protein BroJett003_24140 [Planctomycetota bacterium]|nr:MAG: hypothetical protein BroJett003_24140 [Planctomycetota bacterium]
MEVKKRSGDSWAPILFGLNASKDGMMPLSTIAPSSSARITAPLTRTALAVANVMKDGTATDIKVLSRVEGAPPPDPMFQCASTSGSGGHGEGLGFSLSVATG